MNSPLSRDEFEAKLKYHTELATGLEKGRMEHTPERAELLKFHREQREWIINRLKQTGSTDAFLILRGEKGRSVAERPCPVTPRTRSPRNQALQPCHSGLDRRSL